MSPLKRKLADTWLSRWLPLAFWAGVIFFMSSRSALPAIGAGHRLPLSPAGHFIEYAILALFLFRALRHREAASPGKAALLSLIASVLYGMSDEFHQSFVPNRQPSLWDVAMDGLGAATALAIAIAWHRWRVRARG